MAVNAVEGVVVKTRILSAKETDVPLGKFTDSLEKWQILNFHGALQEAARHLQSSNIPVGFPTETVYGLGADATRSEAVKGIYNAKGRPSDNPLIIHVSDLTMLRSLLAPAEGGADPIPQIYAPLIKKFWPGPLTILLPNPTPSKLAPEVTAGLHSFGARMPNSELALSLIHLAGVPLAAPSANASTKPSPTTAEHVRYDLDGRIELILDGGPCSVGVESTVVDGLCSPPVVLRPGGVSMDEIRVCEGWEGVVKGYKDSSEIGTAAPRAPGMKYKHYSPKAKVVLYEGEAMPAGDILDYVAENRSAAATIAIVKTKTWDHWGGVLDSSYSITDEETLTTSHTFAIRRGLLNYSHKPVAIIYEITLGSDTKLIAQGLFSALRELDQRGVSTIYVEGVPDVEEESLGAAVMNRLRKAASVIQT